MELSEQNAQDLEDDDVLFAGSPLYESLVASGVPISDLDVEPQDGYLLEGQGLISSEVTRRQPEAMKEKESCLRKILMKVQAAFRFLLHLIVPTSVDNMDLEMNKLIVADLLRAKVLDDDDREFLEKYLKDVPTDPQAEHIESWLFQIFQYSTRKKLHQRRETISNHIKAQLFFLSWMKKCLRLIQESELIARGFTLVSQKTPVSLIEQSNVRSVARQCPELRKLLFFTVREAIMVCREQTKNIIKNLPLSSDLDAAGRYLAFQALESYGPCLQISANEEAELYDLTDGFSVAALKGMVQLCHLHQSEFVRRLILILDYSSRDTSAKPISSRHLKEITALTTRLHESSNILEKSYDFHNSYLLKAPEPEKVKVTGQSSPCEDIGVAVHSLDLHLQAALTRVRHLSSWLEEMEQRENENQSNDTDFLSHDTLTQMMQPIRAELESCRSCWEEGINRIDKLQKTPSADTDKLEERPTAVTPSKTGSVKLVQVEDPIILDQVFEAYTDDDHKEQRDYSWEQPLTAEDKAKRKREKEEALRLLKELKTVISVRSQEMEKREADALLRFRNLTGMQETPKDRSLSVTQEDLKDENLNGTQESQGDRNNMTGTDETSEDGNLSKSIETYREGIIDTSQESFLDMTDNFAANKEPTDNTKLILANDGCVHHSQTSDSTDSAIIVDRDRHKSNKISCASIVKPDIVVKGTDPEFEAELNDDSESKTEKESYSLTSQEDNDSYIGGDAIDETGPVIVKNYDSDEFLNISDGASHKSLLTSSFEDIEKQEGDNTSDGVSASDKSSSYANISANSDVDSVYSAISYDNDDGNPGNLRKDSENDSSDDTEILELSNEMDHNISSENLEAESNANETDNPKTLEERLKLIHGANLSFTSNIAALAAAKSRAFGLVQESSYGGETFGDLSDSEEDSSAQ